MSARSLARLFRDNPAFNHIYRHDLRPRGRLLLLRRFRRQQHQPDHARQHRRPGQRHLQPDLHPDLHHRQPEQWRRSGHSRRGASAASRSTGRPTRSTGSTATSPAPTRAAGRSARRNYDGTGVTSSSDARHRESRSGAFFGPGRHARLCGSSRTAACYAYVGQLDRRSSTGSAMRRSAKNHIMRVNLTHRRDHHRCCLAPPMCATGTGGGVYSDGRLIPTEGQIIAIDVDQAYRHRLFHHPADQRQRSWRHLQLQSDDRHARRAVGAADEQRVQHAADLPDRQHDPYRGRRDRRTGSTSPPSPTPIPSSTARPAPTRTTPRSSASPSAPRSAPRRRCSSASSSSPPTARRSAWRSITRRSTADHRRRRDLHRIRPTARARPPAPVVAPVSAVTVTDADTTVIQGATIAITTGFFAGDTLELHQLRQRHHRHRQQRRYRRASPSPARRRSPSIRPSSPRSASPMPATIRPITATTPAARSASPPSTACQFRSGDGDDDRRRHQRRAGEHRRRHRSRDRGHGQGHHRHFGRRSGRRSGQPGHHA